MHLATLAVRNFRNIAALDVELPAEGVVLLGPNGQGKTNFLESIYYLVLFRSFRGAKDRELIRFGEAGFFLAGGAGARVTAGFEAAGRRKKVTVNGTEIRKLVEAVGTITAVVFSPADREIVAAGPAHRRRYLDVVLSLTQPGYLPQLSALRGALKQRNAALRRGHAQEATAFDAPFVAAATRIVAARREWVERWRARFAELGEALGEPVTTDMQYRARHPEIADAMAAALERDLRRGMTTVGPHRDDLQLSLGGHDLRRYGSAGQQRTMAVVLRLLEAESVSAARGATPLALYDDVFAELDANRQARLLALIQHTLQGQVIVTAPRESEVPPALLERERWCIRNGRIES